VTALDEAAWIYSRLENYDRQQRLDAIISLNEWGAFSLRNLGSIFGISHTHAARFVTPKSVRTGGTFSPECLAPLLEIRQQVRRGEPVEPSAVAAMLSAGTGTSVYFAARLAGVNEHWLRRQLKKGANRE
jgi:hypothetical protein